MSQGEHGFGDLFPDWTIGEKDRCGDRCAVCDREGRIGADLELLDLAPRGGLVLCLVCSALLAALAAEGVLAR